MINFPYLPPLCNLYIFNYSFSYFIDINMKCIFFLPLMSILISCKVQLVIYYHNIWYILCIENIIIHILFLKL